MGINLFTDLKKIEKKTMLNHSIFGYFDQCQLINETLLEYGFVFCFFWDFMKEETNLDIKLNKIWNKMKRELSSCIIQKFNGYELIRNNLNILEKKILFQLI